MPNATLDDLLSACRAYAGGDPDGRVRGATEAFLANAKLEPEILRSAAGALATLPPAGASWLALTLGTAVEKGADVEIAGPAVVGLFLKWLSNLPDNDTDTDEPPASPPNAEQIELLNALPYLCNSVVAHVARMPQRREELSRDLAVVARLERLSGSHYAAEWVHELLARRSGRIVVLHPPSGAGYRIRYQNVATCFHLFSLIQAALGTRVAGARSVSVQVGAAAHGETGAAVTDRAWWHYGDPRSKTAALGASIWGEASVDSIPVIKDVQVLLLWPPLLGGRSWDSGFFGPRLDAAPPKATVEAELSEDERRAWFLDLGIEFPKRRWWRPW